MTRFQTCDAHREPNAGEEGKSKIETRTAMIENSPRFGAKSDFMLASMRNDSMPLGERICSAMLTRFD
jgi:hypothetical protein